jgi:hypothetical protein
MTGRPIPYRLIPARPIPFQPKGSVDVNVCVTVNTVVPVTPGLHDGTAGNVYGEKKKKSECEGVSNERVHGACTERVCLCE